MVRPEEEIEKGGEETYINSIKLKYITLLSTYCAVRTQKASTHPIRLFTSRWMQRCQTRVGP